LLFCVQRDGKEIWEKGQKEIRYERDKGKEEKG
jgi:hypothetical protein